MSTARTLRNLQPQQTESQKLASDLSSRGFTKSTLESGEVQYSSPPSEYISYQDKKLRQTGLYSKEVYVFNSSGQLIKKIQREPYTTDAYDRTVMRSIRDKVVEDYIAGTITTDNSVVLTNLARTQIAENEVKRSGGLSQVDIRRLKAEDKAKSEAYESARRSNIKSVEKRGDIVIKTLRSPTYLEPFQMVQQRAVEKKEKFYNQFSSTERKRVETAVAQNPNAIIVGIDGRAVRDFNNPFKSGLTGAPDAFVKFQQQQSIMKVKQNGNNNSTITRELNNSTNTRASMDGNLLDIKTQTGFERRVEALEQVENYIFKDEKFARVSKLANMFTQPKFFKQGALISFDYNNNVPLLDRSFLGQTSEIVATGLLGGGVGLVGGVFIAGAKMASVSEGLFKNPIGVSKELFVNAPKKLEAGPFSFLPFGTPINPEGASTLIVAGAGAGIGYTSFKNNPITRASLQKAYPELFVDSKKLNIQFVEDYTVPTSRAELLSLEGKRVKTIHVTASDVFAKDNFFITKANPATAGKRAKNYLLNFYKSSPIAESVKNVNVAGYTTKAIIKTDLNVGSGLTPSVSTSIKQPVVVNPYTKTISTGRAYLGYVGILKEGAKAPSSSRVVFGKPTIRLLISNDMISITPESIYLQGVRATNRYQAMQSGKTFVPAENLASTSPEGQFITPSSYKGLPRAKEFGLENTQGSIIQKVGKSKFTFYKKSSPQSNNPLARLNNMFDEITGRNYFKMELIKTKTKAVPDIGLLQKKSPNVNLIDVEDYNMSYGNTRYLNPRGEILSASRGLSSVNKRMSAGSYSSSGSSRVSNKGSRSSFSKSLSRSPYMMSASSVSSAPSSAGDSYFSYYPSENNGYYSSTPSYVSYIPKSFNPSSPVNSYVPTRSSVPFIPSILKTPNYPFLPPKNLKIRHSEGVENVGYDVYVREGNPKGKKTKKVEIKVNKKPLPYNAAWNLGENYVDETTARSFRLVQKGKTNINDDYSRRDIRKYRVSKNRRYAVEKNLYAIDSFGELQGITAKGLKKRQETKRKNSLLRF